MMKTAIIADRTGAELQPLTDRRPVGLLPVANRPLITHTFEELHNLGIRESSIVVKDADLPFFEKVLGGGERWGVKITWCAVPSEMSTLGTIDRCAFDDDAECLVVRGDMLRPFGVLEEALKRRDHQSSADFYTAMGISIFKGRAAPVTDISWPNVSTACQFVGCSLTSIDAYLTANGMALAGTVPGVRVRGRSNGATAVVGYDSKIKSPVPPTVNVAIGNWSLVEKDVDLHGDVIIGDECVVDRRASLSNVVVLPNTYIGQGVQLSNAVVDGSTVWRRTEGAVISKFCRQLFCRTDVE